MGSKFDEEKRVLINDLTEEKAAHMQTLELLAEEKRKSSAIPKYEQELASLRTNFEDIQKKLIQSQKKQVEERNKNVVSNQEIEQLQLQLEQMQEANDKTQTLLEESMQELDEHKALIQSNPNLQEIQETSSELSMLRERVVQLEKDLVVSQEENARMASLLAAAQTERDRAVEEMKGSKTSISTLQAQLEEAMFNLEMSSETIKDLNSQLSVLGVVEDSPALTRSTSNLLEQENARLSEEVNTLKTNLVATETRLTRTTKQLNAFRLSASHDAKRNQATISSLQNRIAGISDIHSPSSTPEPPASPSPTPTKQHLNGVYEIDSDGEIGEINRSREVEDMKREVEALQSQLRDAQAELEVLRAKKAEDSRALHDTQDLRMQYELSQTELEAMRADLERVEKELDRKQAEAYTVRTQLAEELELFRLQVNQLQEALRKEEQGNADLTQELERERAKETTGGEGRQEELDALREQLQRAQEAHDNLLRAASDDEVVSLRAKVDESEGEAEKLREELERLKDNLETEAHMNSELTKSLEQEKNNHASHEDTKQAEIDVLREKLRDSDKDLQIQAQQYHQKLEQSALELSELRNAMDGLKNEYQTTTSKLDQAQDELDKSRVQFLELQDKLERSMFDNLELEKRLEERTSVEEEETIRSQLQQSQDDFEKASDANAELERQLEQALAEVESLKAGMKEEEGQNEQIDALRAELNQLLNDKKRLEEEKAKSRARDLQVEGELEELRAQVRESEKLEEKWNQAKDNLEKAANANAELEKQYNLKQVELNTHRVQMLDHERETERLRVELLQAQDVIEKLKATNSDLERRSEEERSGDIDYQEQIDSLRLQLQQTQDALESEIQSKLDSKQDEQDEQDKAKREADDLEKRNTEFERHLALLRAEEGVLRAQLHAAHDEIMESRIIIEEQEREKETGEQEREQLASMLEELQKSNEELSNKIRKYESLKLNGKQESPRRVLFKEEKSVSSESEQEAERESEEIVEDEADDDEEVERDEEGEVEVEGEIEGEEQEEEIEDDDDEEDGEEEEEEEKEELVAELQEQIKDEQQRTTNLVQAIYTLQIELQQEKAKQGEMDEALVELQKGNQRLTQEVYDLRNAWTESSFFNSSFTSDKGISSFISEIPKESSVASPSTSTSSPRKKDGNAEWDGLENEINRAAGLRAVALRTIFEDLENAKDKDVKMANLRTQQFQLIDKLNDTEVELAESRHILSNLQAEYEKAKRTVDELKSAKELVSKLAQLEQQNAALNERLEKALDATVEAEYGHRSTVNTLETQIVNREQHNASINERLKEALGLATDAEEEHVKTVFALEEKIDKLEAKNATLASRLEENDEAALALVSAQEEYRKMVLALETKQRELESHNTDLNEELEKAKTEIEKLLEENDNLERNAVSLAVHTNTTARDLEDSVAAAKAELAEASEELEILRAERENTNKELKSLMEERENAGEEVKILLIEREKMIQKIEELERIADNAEVLEVRNSGLQRQIEELEFQLRESTRSKREGSSLPLSRSSSFSESFDAKRKASESESLEHRNAALASMTDELRQRINELESNPDEIETLSQEVATLEEERNILAKLVKKLERECKRLREQVKGQSSDSQKVVSEEFSQRVAELEEENEKLKNKVRKQEELHENFVVSTEEERAVNHSNFVNLQTALNEEREGLVSLKKQLSELKLENNKLSQTNADDTIFKSSRVEAEVRELQHANTKLREELALAKSQCAHLKVETDALTRIQTEVTRLKEEMNDEKHKAKKWKKENKELKEECRELKRDKIMERELTLTSSRIGKDLSTGELGSIKEEHATLRGECKVLREDRNIWREECSKAKDETKKWRDNCSALELEMREVKIVQHEEVQLIASLKRENELLRRDNEMLWEQMDSWGALDGLGKGAKDTTHTNNTTNNINIDGISTILHPDSLNDASMKEDKGKSAQDRTTDKVKSSDKGEDNKEEGEEEDVVNTSGEGIQLTRSLLSTHPQAQDAPTNTSRTSTRATDPSPIPTHAPRLHPDFHPFSEDQPYEDVGIDTHTSVMLEAQTLAHHRQNAMILTQMEKLATQLQALVRNARSANNAQNAHHTAHLAHAVSQAHAERDATLRLRDAYETDSQRIQEASLEALRAHVNGIKSVYNALSY